jgi:HSP20 family protein
VSSTRTPQPRSTSFLVAIGCPHGALPRRVDIPIEEYQEDERRFVRVYLPGADPDRDIRVNLRGSALRLRGERRVEYPDCDSTAPHHVTFDKVLSVPAGTTPDDVAAEYGEGVLLVSWPTVPPSAQHTSSHVM